VASVSSAAEEYGAFFTAASDPQLSVITSPSAKEVVRLQFRSRTGVSKNVPLPPLAFKLLIEILEQTASGNAVAILPLRKEVTTHEAAEILNVSRPFVIGLLEKGEIPFRKVGAHRRIPLSALLEYKRKTAAIRDEALDFLAGQAQELKLY
jgi:excisionase family DNA binding protein